MTLSNNVINENNVKLSNCDLMCPPWVPSSQWREANLFTFAIYDNELSLRSLVTAGDPGVAYICEGTESLSVNQVMVNIAFTDHWSSHGDLWGQIAYITRDIIEFSQGFYIWAVNHREQLVSLVPFMGTLGPFRIICNLHLSLMQSTRVRYYKPQEIVAAKTAHRDFYKDKQYWDHHGCSYTQYMVNIIDELTRDKTSSQVMLGEENQLGGAGYCDHQVNLLTGSKDEVMKDTPEGSGLVSRLYPTPNIDILRDFNLPDKTVGYLALEPTTFRFIGPDRSPVDIISIDKCLQVANIILSTAKPNYQEARIPIVSGLNIKMWEKYLQDYPDDRLIQYIKFGFPLSIQDRSQLHNTNVCNHYSALQYPTDIQKYLHKEIELGAMLGPQDSVDHPEYHCSPLMSRPKEGDNRRVILDLSYPRGQSLNDHVSKDRFDGNLFALKLPSIDNVVQDIIDTVNDPVLFKVDVARAFRNLPVDPADTLKFGLKINNQYFLDKSVAFGWIHGTASYQLISDAVAYIMRDQTKLHCYIDDYVAVLPRSKADNVFQNLCTLLSELGLPLNLAKLTAPSKTVTYLGIDIDVNNSTLSIPQAKLSEILAECAKAKDQKYLTKRAYQSLMGKLLYIQKCVRSARVFINRILALFRQNSGRARIQLNEEFQRDIAWFLEFLPTFNGITYFRKPEVDESQTLFLDASLTGLGGVWRRRVFATPVRQIPGFELTIVHLEMLNVVIALRLWGSQWRHMRIHIFCDNYSVVQVIRSGKTKDPFLALCIRNLWLLTAHNDIEIEINHIPGVKNSIADTLSRIYSPKPVNNEILQDLLDNYNWDNVDHAYFDLSLHV